MRLISAVALFSATVYATRHQYGNWNEGKGHQKGQQKDSVPTPYPVQDYPAPDYPPPAPPAPQEDPGCSTAPAHEMPSETPVNQEDQPTYEAPSVVEEPPAPTTPPPSQTVDVKPPAEGPQTHTVTVGGDAGLVYTPAEIIAEIGDVVHFVFHKQNHSVTQSTFDKPCNKLDTGEDSGLLPNPNNTVVPAPTWAYEVKEKVPTCKQAP